MPPKLLDTHVRFRLELADPDITGVVLQCERAVGGPREFRRDGDAWVLDLPRPAVQRFEYRFAAGRSHGVHREWYRNGRPLRRILFRNGQEVEARAWRENGRLFANYVVKAGVIYGLNNASLCLPLGKGRKGGGPDAPSP